MAKNSGKNRGSLTQKADSQQVRISQVSNVSKAVSNMGKKTTQKMEETERRVNEGTDVKAMAGSMTSVLDSLKVTVDTLNKGVETATLGTAKAAKDAISQYGKAITEDYSVNRKNMVASALGSASPIFGHFAAKFLETGIFKSTAERMKKGISDIFQKKSKGGSMPDDFGDFRQKTIQNKAQDQQKNKQQKQTTIEAFKIANKEKVEKYDKPSEERMLTAVVSVQKVLGGQLGKFDQWYSRMLLEHPYFRVSMTAAKATSSVMGGTWKAVYFFWKKRGGYAKYMSKSKQPLEAINQNIAQTFVQMMPRLDAIMVYNKATAEAIRDLSTHVTGKKYGRVDPNRIQGTWTLAGGTMSALRWIGKKLRGAADATVDRFTSAGSRTNRILKGGISAAAWTGRAADMTVTGPGRMRDWVKGKTLGKLPGNIERQRAFGGLGATGFDMPGQRRVGQPITDPRFLLPAPQRESKMKKWLSKIKMPKMFKGMGKKLKPTAIVQGVYDEFMARQEKKKDKERKKMYGMTSDIASGVKQHNKREKRKTVFSVIGSIFSAIGSIVTFAWGFISPFIGIFKRGIAGFIGSMIGGGVVRAALGKMGLGLITALASPWVIGTLVAALSGVAIGSFINKYIIQPFMGPYFEKREKNQATGISELDKSRERLNKQKLQKGAKGFSAKAAIHARADLGNQKALFGDILDPEAVKSGQMGIIEKNKSIYSKYTSDELDRVRREWRNSWGYTIWYSRMSRGADPFKFGAKKEQHFLNYLKKEGTPMSKKEYKAAVKDYDVGKAKAAAAAAKKKEAKAKSKVNYSEAIKFIKKYGGRTKDYVGKKYSEAEAYGKKLVETTKETYRNWDKVGIEDATLLIKTYGGQAKDYVGKNFDQALNYGMKLLDDNKGVVKKLSEKGKVGIAGATQYVKKYGGQVKDYVGKTYAEASNYGLRKIAKTPQFAKEKGKVGFAEATQLVGKYGGKVRDYIGLPMSQVQSVGKGLLAKIGRFVFGKDEANIEEASKFARKYGGEVKDYIGKSYRDATAYGKSLLSKKSSKKVIDKTKVGKTFASKLVRKYGGEIGDYIGKSYMTAVRIAKQRIMSKRSKLTQSQEEVKIHEVTKLIRRYGGDFKDYYGKTFAQAEAYGRGLISKSSKSKTKDVVGQARASKLVMQYGGVRGDYVGKPIAQAIAFGKKLVATGKGFMSLYTGTVGLNSATKLSLKFGGQIREYIGKKYNQAVAYGKSLINKGKYILSLPGIGITKASQMVRKFGGNIKDYVGKKYDQAVAFGKGLINKTKNFLAPKVGIAYASYLIRKYGGQYKDYVGQTYSKATSIAKSRLAKEKQAKIEAAMPKVGQAYASKLVRKYGGNIKDYVGKTYAAAVAFGKKRIFSTPDNQTQEEVKYHEITKLIRRYGGNLKDYYGKTYAQAVAYGKSLITKSGKISTKGIGKSQASKFIRRYGGNYKDYVGKTPEEAKSFGQKLLEKGKFLAGAGGLFTGTIGLNRASKLALKYGGNIRDYVGKKYEQAVSYGKSLVDKATNLFKSDKVDVGMLEASKFAQKYGGSVTDYIGKSYSEAERVGKQRIFNAKKKPEERVGVVAADRLIQRYGGYRRDYIGKTFTQAEAYGRSLLKRKPIVSAIRIEESLMQFKRDKGKTRLRELWSKASPEQKEYIRQHAQEILAGGDQAAKALDKLEKGMKDASDKNAKQVGGAVVSSAVHTTTNISNAVNNISQGGGSSKNNLLNEKTMDDIMRGDLSF